jgi:hypothetical protein
MTSWAPVQPAVRHAPIVTKISHPWYSKDRFLLEPIKLMGLPESR